ncbi:MAG TPA: molybdopterin cofactor-binding domain-containing protein [Bryobacteraceae bacterium]|nr:molybdopterin cofactor-binding domain-containing protein [Bryobacteraceae bacterium]
MIDVVLTVNDQPVRRKVDERLSLLRFLRDDLGLCGTKEGCSTGDCGTCVVLVNGQPEDACLFNMRRAKDIRVDTIESLCPKGGPLHPLQAAFLDCGAVQCGFCIPGMLMASKALLDREPSPSEAQIRDALKDVICRCTGYVQIFEAVQKAAHWIAYPEEFARWKPRNGSMGVSAVMADGVASVTGRLSYADDLTREGMVWGQIVWSEHASAEILNIDFAAAQNAPGVIRILTAKDVPGLNGHGRTKPDQPVFCHDRVRYTGDIIALVVAATRQEAEDAGKLVNVDYKILPGVFSPQESLQDGAPQLHSTGNVCKHLIHTVGDVDAAFRSAPHIVEGHFSTQRVDHAYLEPMSALAETIDGVVTIHVPQQAPFETREQLLKILDLPKEQVRIVCTPLGGGFGGKLEISIEAVAAVAAYRLRRPVKITLSREENLHNGVKRHPYEMDYRVAADEEGHLLAVDAKLVSDAGPYTGNSPRVIDQACIFSCGPYRVPNVRIEGIAVLTNNANCGAFRGYGINQAAVAMEQLIDELALKLGKDPFEIRRINMLREGDVTITGQWLPSSVGALPTLEACKKAFEEEWPQFQKFERPGFRIGYGVAAGYKNVGAGKGKVDDSGATYTLLPSGNIELSASVVDMGQSIRTTMLQLACQATGLDPSRFQLITGDTALTHPHRSASGERQTLISGNAVVMAGKAFKQKLLSTVARWTGRAMEELAWEGDVIKLQWSQYREEEQLMTLAEAADRASQEGFAIQAEAVYVSPKTYPLSDIEARKTVPREEYRNYPTYAYATQAAIVEVEEATGHVRLLRMIAAHDVGVAINPQQIRGQLIGSIVMSQGYALTEDYPMKDGRPPNRTVTFGRLGVPLATDAPSVRVEIVEDPFPEGPYGAKGISEIATVPTPPAILNAIHNATGIRVRRMPVDPRLLKRGQPA